MGNSPELLHSLSVGYCSLSRVGHELSPGVGAHGSDLLGYGPALSRRYWFCLGGGAGAGCP